MEKGAVNVGLRVAGSKKGWKRGGAFGMSFSTTGSALLLVPLPASFSLTADESLELEVESIDVLVCKELADSLLDTVTAHITAQRLSRL